MREYSGMALENHLCVWSKEPAARSPLALSRRDALLADDGWRRITHSGICNVKTTGSSYSAALSTRTGPQRTLRHSGVLLSYKVVSKTRLKHRSP
jgi:hypothetical protein